ncbi:MAG: phosphate/phosphite/phosphonate ABC transporter substrate-binding protein [Ghiorsea sp.]
MNVLTLMLVISCLVFTPLQVHAGSNKLAFSGVVLDQGNNTVLNQFTQWLSTKADYNLQPSYQDSYQAITDYLLEHKKCMAWTCGAPFVEDYLKYGQVLIATPLFQGKPTYYSLVITKKGRHEKTLADFKGKTFAYSDPRSNSGFLSPSYELKKQGITISKHFSLMIHTSLHEGSINAVLNGLADVANVDEYILVQYLKAHPEAKDKVVVLEQYGPYPFTPIVAGSNIDPQVVTRLQQALITMHEDPEGEKLLKKLGLDGFVVKAFSFYQPILDMLDTVRK